MGHGLAAKHGRQTLSVPSVLRSFWNRAYDSGITGLAGMVAYNLVLALFPFTLLLLFIFGRVLESPSVEEAVVDDVRQLLPAVERPALQSALASIRSNAGTLGIVAAGAGIWIGASFWGALDTAFCRIYHRECRSWVHQKLWAFGMLVVVAIFLAATVLVPIAEGVLVAGADGLPAGLGDRSTAVRAVALGAAMTLTFAVSLIVFVAVPRGRVPWYGVWPGAALFTVATALLNWIFPIYLNNISTITRFGSTVTFVLIALVWFYVISLIMLACAVVNANRIIAREDPDEADPHPSPEEPPDE